MTAPVTSPEPDFWLSMTGEKVPYDDLHRCFICGEVFELGQLVIEDIDEGTCHRSCCGEDRASYVNFETGEPIGPDDPIPTGEPYQGDPLDAALSEEDA